MNPIYRLTVYAPRSVDPDEATVLTPKAGGAHSDTFKVATATGVTGFQPYMGTPRGRTGRIDPLSKSTDTGQLTVPVHDVRNTAGGTNLNRWVTTFMGDAQGRNQLLGLKVYVEISTDNGDNWSSYFTGRIQTFPLEGRLKYLMTIRDMREGLDAEIFTGPPHPSATGPVVTNLMPNGPIESYASFWVVLKFTGTVLVSGGQTAISPNWSNHSHKCWSYFIKKWPGASEDGKRAIFRNNEDIRIHVKITSGARTDEEGDCTWIGISTGNQDVAYKDENGHWRLRNPVLKALDASDPDYMALPPDGETVEYYIYHYAEPTEETPILIDSVHVGQLWKDLLDGLYSRLNSDGTVVRTINYDSSAFASLIADNTLPLGRFRITGKAVLKEWTQKYICEVYDLTYYLDEDGQVVPVDLRLPSSLSGIPTLANSHIDTDVAPGWEPDRGSAITVIEADYYSDHRLPQEIPTEAPPGLVDMPATMIETMGNRIRIEDIGNPDLGEKAIKIDAIGFRTSPDETIEGMSRDIWIPRHLEGSLRAMCRPYRAGAAYATLICNRTIDTTAQASYSKNAIPGQLWIVDVDELPDPATNLRGGTRLMRVIERREDGPRVNLVLLDMGPNTVAVAPVIATPSSPDMNSISVGITLNASNEPARVEYAITAQSVGTIPAADSAAWTYGGTVTATGSLAIDKLPSGKRVWVRARSEVTASDDPKLPSSWAVPASTGYVNTASLTAPSSCATANETASTADLSWSNGESGYPIEILLILGASPASWTDDELLVVLAPGTTGYTLRGLDGPSIQHTVGVRHRDPYGGVSAVDEDTFSTTASVPTAPRPAGIAEALTGNMLD